MTAVALTTASCSLEVKYVASCSMSAVVTDDGTEPTLKQSQYKIIGTVEPKQDKSITLKMRSIQR